MDKAQRKGWLYGLGILLSLFFLVMPLSQARAETVDVPTVRVLIDQPVTVEIKIASGRYGLIDEQTGMPIDYQPTQGDWRITAVGRALQITSGGQALPRTYSGPIYLHGIAGTENILEINGKKYRGNLRIYPPQAVDQRGLVLINDLDLESYLYGVVGPEMGFGAPQEALKAQAVVSRSYALYHLTIRQRSNSLFDLRADTSSQVYRGIEGERDHIRQVVDDTRGQVLHYDGRVIEAVYHSNAGGKTESAQFVWNESRPYLEGVTSPDDAYAEELSTATAAAYRWRKTITAQEITERAQSITGRDIGTVKAIRIAEKSPTGRVIRLEVVGSKETITVDKLLVRALVNTPSTLFTVASAVTSTENTIVGKPTGNSTITVLAADESPRAYTIKEASVFAMGADLIPRQVDAAKELFILSQGGLNQSSTIEIRPGDTFTLQGHGYGHGVGMSQWGAMGMSIKGKTYKEIVEHYYGGSQRNGRLQIVGDWGT
ncbi:SpoIID/LytB domain-containing protein [Heliorestis convoluta]|uniref:SpoIID/LytB domain-containing protein n=1 Tax=Heliorestis convoluta TaxID=356322 RepID=UPI00129BC7CE|nr:SpoIID/LytB domain-containing protein [Heliorestis convoluta]